MKKIRLFFILSLLLGLFSILHAQEYEKKINVGFFKLDGYHECAENGEKSGYGYEFLQLISGYADFNYNYVGYGERWRDMLGRLDEGSIDFVTFAKRTPELEKKYDFSMHSIGSSYAILTVAASNPIFKENGYSVFDGMRVGMIESVIRKESFARYAAQHKLEYVPVYFKTVPEMEKALAEGKEIDAMVSDSLRRFHNEVVIDEFDSRDFYVIAKKGNRALLNKIDNAINALTNTNPGWKRDLYNKYAFLNYSSDLSLSEPEKEYLDELRKKNKKIRILANPEVTPYSFSDGPDFKGAFVDTIRKYLEIYHVPYEFIRTANTRTYIVLLEGDNADIIMDYPQTISFAEEQGWRLTTAISEKPYSVFVRNSSKGAVKTIGLVRGTVLYHSVAKKYFPDAQILYYDSPAECFDAVKHRVVDATINFSGSGQAFVVKSGVGIMHGNILEGEYAEIRIAVSKRCDTRLFSIMNKISKNIKPSEIEVLSNYYLSRIHPDFTMGDYFRSHPNVFFALGIVLFTILSGITIVVRIRSVQEIETQKKISAMAQAISKTYIACYHYDLVKWVGTEISADAAVRRYMPKVTGIDKAVEAFEENDLPPEMIKQNRDFWNFRTVSERLRDRDIVSRKILTKTHGWVELNIVTYKRNEGGRVTDVLWMTREIVDKENV